MAPPGEPLPFTRDACLRALGLDPSTHHDGQAIDAAYRMRLLETHPDTAAPRAGDPETLNRVIHARNMLSSGTSFGSRGRGGGRYAPSSDGYAPMSEAYSRGVLPMERTQMGRGEGPDGAVEVPNAGVQVVRGERAHGVGRRVHGHGVHAGVGEAHGEEAKGGKKSTASSGNGATTRGLTQLTRVGSESNRSMLY